VESELKKKRKATVEGFVDDKEGFKPGIKE